MIVIMTTMMTTTTMVLISVVTTWRSNGPVRWQWYIPDFYLLDDPMRSTVVTLEQRSIRVF